MSGSPAEALRAVERELEGFQESGNWKGQAGCAPLLFKVHCCFEDQVNDALGAAQVGIDLFRELGDAKGEASLWLSCAEVHLRARMHDACLEEAQEALMLFRDLADQSGEDAANTVITEVYCQKGKPQLAPNRPEAVQLLHRMAEALQMRDPDGWKQANERLSQLATTSPIITEEDEVQILGPVVGKDPNGAMSFMQENAPVSELELAEIGDAPQVRALRVGPSTFTDQAKMSTYLNFRFGGIHYGPRFRCVDWCAAKTSELVDVHDEQETVAYGIVSIQSCAEDWEAQLRLSPCILDCSLQTASVLGSQAPDIQRKKYALREPKKPPPKGKKKQSS